MTDSSEKSTFQSLGLSAPVLKAVEEVGYETPSPIQAESIPALLQGHDLLGQAQTGTGKTAAFALPLLSRMDIKNQEPQLLVLAPTRELAIQVAEAFQKYARHIPNFHVLPLYGGQAYNIQLRQLRRGAQVIVGTPGRVMDHIRRETLKLHQLKALVLDEADEMLRMGFIDDVEWILEHTPESRQIALFSATMPAVIRKVANRHLNNPTHIKITERTTTAKTIRQRFWQVSGLHKLDALTRILETEDFDAMIVFVRTKTATVDLAEKLSARGYACEALNGDIQQNMREKIVERLRQGKLDILIATDVVARGLDVERISHVVNYDIPHDTESYVHRIGRTGRAGRTGDAILFVAPREQRLLRAIEKATNQPIERMDMPSTVDINKQRVARFKQKISDVLASQDLEFFDQLVSDFQHENDVAPIQIAAALAHIAQGDEPLLLNEKAFRTEKQPRKEKSFKTGKKPFSVSDKALPLKDHPDVEMLRFRLAVGYEHEVKPGNIVGAIANEAGIDSQYIGHIEIYEDFSTVDLPGDMPKDIFQTLKKARVRGHKLEISLLDATAEKSNRKPRSRKPRQGDDKRSRQKPENKGKKRRKDSGGKPKPRRKKSTK